MATYSTAVPCDNSSLANFQAWTNAIWTAIVTTFGWVQTGDTGQAAHPIASVPSSAFVYWIFKANDASAATTPIYFKIELGYNSTHPAIQVSVGSGSDGAGNLTGSIMGPYSFGTTTSLNNQGAGTFNCYFSGDAGNFRMMMWQNLTPGTAAGGILFGIERSRDTSGNVTTDYVSLVWLWASTATAGYQNFAQQTMKGGAVTQREFNLFAPQTTSGGPTGGSLETEAFAGNVAANPVFPLVGYLGNPMLGFCTAAYSDVAESAGTVVSVSIYGGTHSYLATKQGGFANAVAPYRFDAVDSIRAILMLYE